MRPKHNQLFLNIKNFSGILIKASKRISKVLAFTYRFEMLLENSFIQNL